jgi:hypothetical protein
MSTPLLSQQFQHQRDTVVTFESRRGTESDYANLRDAAIRRGRGLQEGRAQVHTAPRGQTEGQSQRLTWAGKTPPFIYPHPGVITKEPGGEFARRKLPNNVLPMGLPL